MSEKNVKSGIFDKLSKYFHTLRYLKSGQIIGRLRSGFRHPKIDVKPAPCLRRSSGSWCAPARRVPSMIGSNVFCFLNESRELRGPQDWNAPDIEKLWLYNLHYFDDLNAAHAHERNPWHTALIARWIAENPPGLGNGWEPYPSSLRIVNWIKWFLEKAEVKDRMSEGSRDNDLGVQKTGGQRSESRDPKNLTFDLRFLTSDSRSLLESLAVQVRYLSCNLEYHLLGNHLFANAKALVFAGAFFQGPEAEGWMQAGMDILAREIPEQILSDGGQFERSPMYHSIALEDMCDLINLFRTYPESIPHTRKEFVRTWPAIAEKMLDWMKVMCHPDGEIALFNDAAHKIAPSPAEIAMYCERLGIGARDVRLAEREDLSASSLCLTPLDPSGYIRVDAGDMVAFLDTAPIGPDYLPGHAHADTLTFELSLFGQRVFVNSGTSCYGLGEERLRQRSTPAHNTVVVNGENSSEVWSGFRVARRAYPRKFVCEQEEARIVVRCAHDGYKRLHGKPVHAREWMFVPGTLRITDTVRGKPHLAQARFHLHPHVRCTLVAPTMAELVLPEGTRILFLVAGGEILIEKSFYHPEFGVSLANRCLAVPFTGELVTEIRVSPCAPSTT
ncbi:MAG: alginate lyase family protein [Desulfoplanes sp.]|nr:alginate lyase family protein [Desulfoplanes sp.]